MKQIGKDTKAKFSDFTKLNTDSIQHYWDGSLHSTLNGFATLSDTIKTYEYDDDFNKIEVQKVEESIAPDYAIHLGIDTSGVQYLKQKNAIVKEEGKDVLAIMPLVKTYCAVNDGGLSMYTDSENIELDAKNTKLKAYLNVGELMDKSKSFDFFAYLKGVNAIKCDIDSKNNTAIKVSMSNDRNSIVQLVGN